MQHAFWIAEDAPRMPSLPEGVKQAAEFVFLPIVEQLRPGDILLVSGACGAHSKMALAIRSATGGRFSHALICSEPPTLVEAIRTGVSTVSLMRCFVHESSNVCVLRYPDPSVAQRAARLAQLEIGRNYSKARAAQSIFSATTLARLSDQGTFCSALVAQAFIKAGAVEFAATPAEKTTPRTLHEMGCLADVTDDIFRKARAPSNAETLTALDGNAAPTLSSRQTSISNRYAKALRKEATRLIDELPELGPDAPPTYFGLLDLVMRARDVAIQGDTGKGTAVAEALDELDTGLAGAIGSGELKLLLEEIQQFDDASCQHALRESFNARPDIDVAAMSGFLQTTRTELAARRTAYESIKAFDAGRSRSAKEYLALENVVLQSLAARVPLLEEIRRRIA